MITQTLMDIGTWSLAIAAIPQFKEMWKHRTELIGVSVSGSAIVFISLLCIATSFALSGWWISLAAQVIPIVNWGLTTFYSWKCKEYEKRL